MSQTRANDRKPRAAVSIVKCEDYTPSDVLRAVKEAVDLLGGMEQFVRPGQRILAKPNLLSAQVPESAVTTHPSVVEAVVSLAMAAGGSCSIGDSPCITGETPRGFEQVMERTGMIEAAYKIGVPVVRFDDGGTEREAPEAKVFRRLLLADALSEADVLINIPKLKTHELTLLTGAVKNLFGCVPGRRKIEFHLQAGTDPVMFSQVLVDILQAVRPRLSVMDGIIGMDGQGPSAGRRRRFGVILASADPVALDAVACRIAGVDPMEIPALRLAHEQGAGVADLAAIEVLGAKPEDVMISDFQLPPHGDMASRVPKPLYRLVRNQLTRTPRFIQPECTGCHACVNVCPVNAISGDGRKLRVDRGECIRCYCCQEVCPQQAIVLRSGRFRGAIDLARNMRRRVRHFLRRKGIDR